MTITEAKLAKLPKYAREEIEGLRSQVDYYERRIGTIFGEHQNTDTVIRDHGSQAMWLPSHTSVRFGRLEDWVDVRTNDDGDGIRIYASGSLYVCPHSSNVAMAHIQNRASACDFPTSFSTRCNAAPTHRDGVGGLACEKHSGRDWRRIGEPFTKK